MKIAFLASTFLPRMGGAEVVVHNLALQCQALGHDVAVITWWGQWKDIHGQVPYPVYPFLPRSVTIKSRNAWKQGRGKRWPVSAQVVAYQLLHRFDVWNVHMTFPAGVMAVPTLHNMKVPVVTTSHGDDLITLPHLGLDLRTNPGLNDAIENCVRSSTFVTAIGTEMRDEYRKANVPDERIVDIPNGVDVAFLQQEATPAHAVRKKLGLEQGRSMLLSVGRNVKQKGYDRIPSIVGKLAEKRSDFVWVIIGKDTASVAEQARAAGVGEFVRTFDAMSMEGGADNDFRMPPQSIIDLHQAADLYILTSEWESFGIVMMEAMAAGTPVVAFETPGSCDLLGDGQGGVLCEAGNEEAMAREIEDLLTSSERRDALSDGAARKANSYDWPIVAKQYISVFERAAAMR